MQDDFIPPDILEEAMTWLLDLKQFPDCRETEARFASWHARSYLHALAWQRALKSWELLGEISPAYEHLWRPAPRVTPLPSATRRRGLPIAGAVSAIAAAAILLLAGPSLVLRFSADHVTHTAENRTVRLDDGTLVEMGGDTAISAEITASARRITLISGEAYFDVVHDARRPFIVDAGGVAVEVLGTAFDVQLAENETTVELARGTVAVSHQGAEQESHFELSPGQMATINHRSGEAVRSTIAVDDIGAWRSGKMFLNDVTVATAVERLQRYHGAWISIPDPALAARRVTGLYDLKHPDRALQALVEPFGGKMRIITSYGRLLSRF